jgi:hypothetical protein
MGDARHSQWSIFEYCGAFVTLVIPRLLTHEATWADRPALKTGYPAVAWDEALLRLCDVGNGRGATPARRTAAFY